MQVAPKEKMEPPSNEQVKELFQAALERPTPTEREGFLGEACAGDSALRARVDALLQGHDQTGFLLDRPAVALLGVAGDDHSEGHDD